MVKEVEGEGMESLLGQRVLLYCLNYIYEGVLSGVNESCVMLTDPSIVYETGSYQDKAYLNIQRLHTEKWYVQRSAIESFGASKS